MLNAFEMRVRILKKYISNKFVFKYLTIPQTIVQEESEL